MGGFVLDLWIEDGLWRAGNDDRSIVTAGNDPDAALDAWFAEHARLTCPCCGDVYCEGACPDCGSYLCAGEAHDKLCAIAHPSGPDSSP